MLCILYFWFNLTFVLSSLFLYCLVVSSAGFQQAFFWHADFEFFHNFSPQDFKFCIGPAETVKRDLYSAIPAGWMFTLIFRPSPQEKQANFYSRYSRRDVTDIHSFRHEQGLTYLFMNRMSSLFIGLHCPKFSVPVSS